jgi:hypothetical protein
MLDGFGLVPVCVDLNLDSYDGPSTHVMRFRGREGWLAVAELQIEGRRKRWTVPFAVGCDEYFHPIPNFMVPNLLACACSYPSPCVDIPPYELNLLLEEAEEQVLRRWLRNQSAELRDFHEQGAQQLAALEGQTDRRMRAIAQQIRQLQRDRRMAKYDLELREELDAAILRLEVEQDASMSALRAERLRLRTALEDQEDALLDALDVSTRIAKLYEVQWRGRCAQEPVLEEARELAADLQRLFPAGLYAQQADKDVQLTASELETLERFSNFPMGAHIAEKPPLPSVVPEPASDDLCRKAAPAAQTPSKDISGKIPVPDRNADAASSKQKPRKPPVALSAREYEKLVNRVERLVEREREFRASAERAQGKAWRDRLIGRAEHYRKQVTRLQARLFVSPRAPETEDLDAPQATNGSDVPAEGSVTPDPDQASIESAGAKRMKEDPIPKPRREFVVTSTNASWTDEQLVLLKKLWLNGVSASRIAERMGNKSRNAVISKALRMRLPSGRATLNESQKTGGFSEFCFSQSSTEQLPQTSVASIGLPAKTVLPSANGNELGTDPGGPEQRYPRVGKGPSWTEPQMKLLRTWWADGVPASEIAARLETSLSKVIGKAHRLGLPIRAQQKRGTDATKDVSAAV